MSAPVSRHLSNKFANMSFMCALLVVGQHVMRVHSWYSPSWFAFQFVDLGIARIAVPYFFLASGYFLAGHVGEEGWYKRALVKRLFTLVIPFLIWNFAYLICLKNFTFASVVRALGLNPFMSPELGVTWYVRSLLLLVLISPVIVKTLRNYGGGVIVASYVLYVVGYALSTWGSPLSMALVRRCFSFQGLAFFTIGMYLRMHPLDIAVKKFWLAASFVAGVMLMFVKARCFGNMVLFQGLTTLIIPLILLPAWALIPDRPWPKFLVSTSFGVYLVHMFFVRVAQHFAAGWLQTLPGFVIAYSLIVVCSVFFVLAIKRLVPKFAAFIFGGR